MTFRLVGGDAIEAMQAMAENSVDAIVTDPPYGIHFMGKTWDQFGGAIGVDHKTTSERSGSMHAGEYDLSPSANRQFQAWTEAWAREALRVLKPGGHLLSSCSTRTYHRMAAGIEDAGFEIRDCIAWMYGSGFPKSLDVSKAIDKAAGAEREVVGVLHGDRYPNGPGGNTFTVANGPDGSRDEPQPLTAPATPEAQRWNGWGTALKPAFEPIVLARKPLSERNVAANVQRWGTGALNVDGCRVEAGPRTVPVGERVKGNNVYGDGLQGDHHRREATTAGRWPPNVALGHSPQCESTGQTRKVKGITGGTSGAQDTGRYGAFKALDRPVIQYADEDGMESVQVWKCAPGCAVAMLDEQTGERRSSGEYVKRMVGERNGAASIPLDALDSPMYADQGGASRFFYCPKADREERNRGLGHMAPIVRNITEGHGRGAVNTSKVADDGIRTNHPTANHHPTVKPVELMRWLCRMVTPKGGTVLDPFTGSGSTGVAAMREGFEFIGIEREAEYVEIARARIIGDAPLFNLEAVGGGPTE